MLNEKKVYQILKEAAKADLLGHSSSLLLHRHSVHTANLILETIGKDDYIIKDLVDKLPYSLNTIRSFCRMLNELGYLERERKKINQRQCYIYRRKLRN